MTRNTYRNRVGLRSYIFQVCWLFWTFFLAMLFAVLLVRSYLAFLSTVDNYDKNRAVEQIITGGIALFGIWFLSSIVLGVLSVLTLETKSKS